jgi:hypothetical protein
MHYLEMRPTPKEYASFYHAYISAVPHGSIIQTLENQIPQVTGILSTKGKTVHDLR